MPSPRRINRSIGQAPSVGGIPFSIFVPFLLSLIVAFVIRFIFSCSIQLMALLTLWLTASWWITTGGNNYQFVKKFASTQKYIRGIQPPTTLLTHHASRHKPKSSTTNRRPLS